MVKKASCVFRRWTAGFSPRPPGGVTPHPSGDRIGVYHQFPSDTVFFEIIFTLLSVGSLLLFAKLQQ